MRVHKNSIEEENNKRRDCTNYYEPKHIKQNTLFGEIRKP